MSKSEFILKFKQEEIKFFKNYLFLFVLGNILILIENSNFQIGSYQYNGLNNTFTSLLSNIILLLLSNFLLIGLYKFYRKYPSSFTDKKIFYFFLLTDFINVVIIITNYLNLSRINSTLPFIPTTSEILANNLEFIFIFDVVTLIGSVFWILFAHYFTFWFNQSFSKTNDKINSFYYASLFNFLGIIFQVLTLGLYFILNDLSFTFLMGTKTAQSYYLFLIAKGIGPMVTFGSIIIELYACFLIYWRLHNISLGRYDPLNRPYFYPKTSQATNFPTNYQLNTKTQTYEEFMYCKNCGKKIPSISHFCLVCGMKILEE